MMGYGPEDKSSVLELTYNYGITEYDKGNAYAQVKFCFLLPQTCSRKGSAGDEIMFRITVPCSPPPHPKEINIMLLNN